MRKFLTVAVAATGAVTLASPVALMAQDSDAAGAPYEWSDEEVSDPGLEADMASDDTQRLGALADRLSDPAEQDRIAGMAAAMGDVLMALPVGPLIDAAARASGEEHSGMAPDATLGDLAGPDADRVTGEIAQSVPMMMGMLAGMADSAESMRPMLEAWVNTMKAQMEVRGR